METTCLNTELDGSLTLRVWGEGRNFIDAMRQAKKNAVNDVLFNGIAKGLSGYQSRPLVTEVNARQKHEQYFNVFFSDKGAYKKYTSYADRRWGSSRRMKVGGQVKAGVTIRVLVPALKQQLIDDGILKP